MISKQELLDTVPVIEKHYKPLNIFERIQDRAITKSLIKAKRNGESEISVMFFTDKMKAKYKVAGYDISESWDSQGNRTVYIRF